jgi:hypothetical protein
MDKVNLVCFLTLLFVPSLCWAFGYSKSLRKYCITYIFILLVLWNFRVLVWMHRNATFAWLTFQNAKNCTNDFGWCILILVCLFLFMYLILCILIVNIPISTYALLHEHVTIYSTKLENDWAHLKNCFTFSHRSTHWRNWKQ